MKTRFTVIAFFAWLFLCAGAFAATLPTLPNVVFQTSGRERAPGTGDWYTTATSASTDRLHRIQFEVTAAMLAAGGGSVAATVNDADSTNGGFDEVANAPDPTRFELRNGAGTFVIHTLNFPSGSPDGSTAVFNITVAGTYQITSVTGAFPISGDATVGLNDDDNSFTVTVPGTGVVLGQLQSSLVNMGSDLAGIFYFVVPPGTASLYLRNFDLDGNGAVTYVRPSGATISGTTSGNGVWNGGGTLDTGGDTISGLTQADAGVWQLRINPIAFTNQFIIEANAGSSRLALTDTAPGSAGNFSIAANTTLTTATGSPANHLFTVTNLAANNDIINLTTANTSVNFTVQLLTDTGVALTDTDGNGALDTGMLTAGQAKNFILRVTPSAGALGPDVTRINAVSFMDQRVDAGNNTTLFVDKTTHAVTVISGSVFENVSGDGGTGGAFGRGGVRVRAYADVNNNTLVDAGDTFISETTTDGFGSYAFAVSVVNNGTNYLIVADSKSVTPTAGLNGGFAPGDVWAEQTYGDNPATPSVDLGVRFGGRNATISDGFNTASTAPASNVYEHVARVSVSAGNVGAVWFGFSFNAMTNLSAAGATDDDTSANRTVQGSLRQFIQNANAMAGANTLRFTPTVATNASGGGGAWWRLSVTTALPVLTDAATTLDGRAYSSADGTTVRDDNPGSLGAGGTVGVDAVALSQVARPELELVDGAGLALGISISGANAIVRRLAIYGFGNSTFSVNHANIRILATASGALLEQNIIGTGASAFTDAGAGNRSDGDNVWIENASNGTIQNNLVGFNAGNGIFLNNAAGWNITNNEVRGAAIGNPILDSVSLADGTNTTNVIGNLLTDCEGAGVDTFNAGASITIRNNTVLHNGLGAGGSAELSGMRIYGSTKTIDRNIITTNAGSGVMVTPGASAITITRNSIFTNGRIGIDLLTGTDSTAAGTAPYVTPNDSGDGDTGGNGLLNFPVITSADIVGSNLVLAGFARPGAALEFFLANADATGFGEGQTYLTTLTEGSGADTNAGTGTYTNPINGLNQGTDTTNRFAFTIPLPAGVTAGTPLTATATLAGATSEFSGNGTTTATEISGTIFEEVNGDGALGDSSGRPGVRVRAYADVNNDGLVDAGDTFVVETTTNASGLYSFGVSPQAAGTNFLVTVDSKSVTPNAALNGGFAQGEVWAEQTYGDNPATPALDLGVRFGGRNATISDGFNTAATAPASNVYEHVARVSVSGGTVTGVNFGFSFNAMTNLSAIGATDDDASANRTVQGSLRQFIQNANAVSGANTLRFTPAVATNASGNGGDWWSLSVTTALPVSTDTGTVFDGRAYSSADGTTVRDDNPGSLGAGGVVGVENVALGQVARPELEILDGAALALGLDLQGASPTVRRLAIRGFGNNAFSENDGNVRVGAAASGALIEQNIFGAASAASFTDPGAGTRTGGSGLRLVGGDNGIVQNNLIGFCAGKGVAFTNIATGWSVTGNEIRTMGIGSTNLDCIDVESGSATATIVGNLLTGAQGGGVDSFASGGGNVIRNNTVSGNGLAGGTSETAGIRIYGSGNTIDRNIITTSGGNGIIVTSGVAAAITRNSIFTNSQIGIDLLTGSDNVSSGTAPFITPNDSGDGDSGGNGLLNFPVITAAYTNSGNLVLTGFARPGAVLEVFIADNDATGFGEGQTYLTTLTEGSGADTDGGTGTYTNPINGLNQGTDTTNRFTFTIPTPGGVASATRLTATATLASATSEFSGVATVYAGQTVSGTVYNDANRNSRKESTETGTGLTLFAKLLDPAFPANPALAVATVNPATGDYAIPGVAAGLYTIVLDDNATLADITPTLPANWMALESSGGRRPNVAVAAAPVSGQDFGLSQGKAVSGHVFADTGSGGGTANNGMRDGAEIGLANITMRLTNNAGTTTYSTAATDGAGNFALAYPTTLTTGTILKIVETNATGFISTGASVGDTGGTYARATDTVTFTLTANASYANVAFGDVPATTLNTDGAQSALPAAAIFYPHTFTAGTAGTVTFSVANQPTPAIPGWSPVLHRDTNANGVLDAGEPAITAPVAVTAGQVVAILVKEFVPANAPLGAKNKATLTASLVFANAPAITSTLTRTDLTTVGPPQTGDLMLTKSVNKSSALPGETLTYTITYTNRGTNPLTTLSIYDATPAFSTFASAANSALPASLTGVSLTAPSVGGSGAIRWNFTGPLAPGGTGTVSFTVTIDQ